MRNQGKKIKIFRNKQKKWTDKKDDVRKKKELEICNTRCR